MKSCQHESLFIVLSMCRIWMYGGTRRGTLKTLSQPSRGDQSTQASLIHMINRVSEERENGALKEEIHFVRCCPLLDYFTQYFVAGCLWSNQFQGVFLTGR